ncbi:MFS transporter [Algisphaera agarilytica]|uniref:MFS family permease n=1 Tax=Algisphaera agarilytica TaxID=1385975 RepID=A0A7X0H4W3_9BACT|nr:MFS transporter [Algisphaera agarilytica]MBB6429326.1 MFS family permease [Algisphaera agarilytica]
MFGSLWLWTISGAAMTQFARGLGLPDWGFGVLAALPFIGTLFQLPGSWVQERFGRRKAWFLVTQGTGRAMWILAALIPWVMPEPRVIHLLGGGEIDLRWLILLGLVGFSWVMAHLGGPAFMSWFSDLVPRRVRGRYLGLRNTLTLPLSLLATLGVGWWLKQAGVIGPETLLTVASIMLGVAGILGTTEILCFIFVKDPAPSRGDQGNTFGRLLLTPLKDRNFQRYLIYNFTLMLGLGFIGQYVWLFVFDEAQLSPLTANLLLIAVPMILRAIAYPIWGKLVDRLGKKPVMLIAGTMFVFGPMGWLLVTPELIWPGYLFTMISPLSWPGLEIANFNFMLGLAETRKGQRGGSAYVAINSIILGVGGALSGLLGAVIAGAIPEFRVEWVLDVPWMLGAEAGAAVILTYHGVLFLVSMGLRVAALVWATTLHEPRATGTREALRYMTASLYSNVRQGMLMPTRVLGRASRWSYRLGRPGR